jgi:hypothetical protein
MVLYLSMSALETKKWKISVCRNFIFYNYDFWSCNPNSNIIFLRYHVIYEQMYESLYTDHQQT